MLTPLKPAEKASGKQRCDGSAAAVPLRLHVGAEHVPQLQGSVVAAQEAAQGARSLWATQLPPAGTVEGTATSSGMGELFWNNASDWLD